MPLSRMHGARTAILDGSTRYAGLRGTILRKRSATQYDVALDDGRQVTVRRQYCAILAYPPRRERRRRASTYPKPAQRIAAMFQADSSLSSAYVVMSSDGRFFVYPGQPSGRGAALVGVYSRDADVAAIAEDCAA